MQACHFEIDRCGVLGPVGECLTTLLDLAGIYLVE